MSRIERGSETYVRGKGRWRYLYRAVDARGQTIDFWLSALRKQRRAAAASRLALSQPHPVNLRRITVDTCATKRIWPWSAKDRSQLSFRGNA